MKRKLTIAISLVFLLVFFIVFIFSGKFLFDHVDMFNVGYTEEIGFGINIVLFVFGWVSLPGFIVDFIKLCKSSGSPDDK